MWSCFISRLHNIYYIFILIFFYLENIVSFNPSQIIELMYQFYYIYIQLLSVMYIYIYTVRKIYVR